MFKCSSRRAVLLTGLAALTAMVLPLTGCGGGGSSNDNDDDDNDRAAAFANNYSVDLFPTAGPGAGQNDNLSVTIRRNGDVVGLGEDADDYNISGRVTVSSTNPNSASIQFVIGSRISNARVNLNGTLTKATTVTGTGTFTSNEGTSGNFTMAQLNSL